MWTEDGAVIWQRRRSGNDGANYGILQPRDVNTTDARRLILELDVRVNSHTLRGTGWWSEKRGGTGETPVHICVSYLGSDGRSHAWHYGFLVHATGIVVYWRNPATGQRERKSADTSLQNFLVPKPGQWRQVSFDLLDDAVRRGPRGEAMPRPSRITRVYLYGSGWDFEAGVRNISLRLD